MSFIRASGLGPLTASNTATIVDPQTPLNGTATMGPLVSFASQATSTSALTIPFTGIPSWAKRVIVILKGVQTNSTSSLLIQMGYGASPTWMTSGYSSVSSSYGAPTSTAGFIVMRDVQTMTWSGAYTFFLADSATNTWSGAGNVNLMPSAYSLTVSGYGVLSGTLTAIRLNTVSGTDTFTAGLANVMYE